MTHDFTTKSLEYLIFQRGELYKTIKWQPVLTEPCNNTIAQINSELESRGIKGLR
jgi:hypothetical protein